MKNLMAAEAGIIPARPFDGIEHTARSVQQPSGQQPEKAGGGQGAIDGHNGKDGQPAHEKVDGAGKPPGNAQFGNGEDRAGEGQRPHSDGQGNSAAISQNGEAQRGVAAGDEKINRAVVIFPQGQPPRNRNVETVIQGTGGVQSDHGQAVDGKQGK